MKGNNLTCSQDISSQNVRLLLLHIRSPQYVPHAQNNAGSHTDHIHPAECIYSKRFTQQPSPPRTTSSTLRNGTTVPPSLRQANKDSDDAKLVFGTVFSLRRMCRQLGGVDDQFLSYRTFIPPLLPLFNQLTPSSPPIQEQQCTSSTTSRPRPSSA